MRQHAAAKRRQQRDEILADKAASDDAHDTTGQLAADQFLEIAAAKGDTGLGDAVQQRDGKRESQLRHRPPVDAAGPGQLHAVPLERRQVQAVEADTVLADDLQLGKLRQHAVVNAFKADDCAIVPPQQL